MDEIDKINRAHQAQYLLENAMFREVIDGLDGEYHARWRNAQTVEAREDLFRYVKIVERISQDLTSIATTGKFEEARRKELEGAKQKKVFQWPTR